MMVLLCKDHSNGINFYRNCMYVFHICNMYHLTPIYRSLC